MRQSFVTYIQRPITGSRVTNPAEHVHIIDLDLTNNEYHIVQTIYTHRSKIHDWFQLLCEALRIEDNDNIAALRIHVSK